MLRLCLLHRNDGINFQVIPFTQLARNSILPAFLKKQNTNQQIILMQYSCIASRSPSSPASPPRYTLCDDVALLIVPKEMKFLGDILESGRSAFHSC